MPKGKGKGGKGGKGGWADGGKGKSKGKGKDKGQVVDAEGAAAAEGGPALSAGAKRGPPQLGGGSWKKPKVEAIPGTHHPAGAQHLCLVRGGRFSSVSQFETA